MNIRLLNPLYWNKRIVGLFFLSFLLVWFFFVDTYSLSARWSLSQRNKELNERIEQLEIESLELQKRIKELETNPALLEKIAREQYGMRKEGETVYKINRDK